MRQPRAADHYLQAVIFDVDCTLVDSNDAHAQAWVFATSESGRRVEFSRVRPLIGMGATNLIDSTARGISSSTTICRLSNAACRSAPRSG